MSNGYQETLSIERIDNNKGYCPENCTWIEMSQQAKNRRNTTSLTVWGETKSETDWAIDPRCQVTRKAFRYRLRTLGWKPEDALSLPKYSAKQRQNILLNKP